MMNRHYPARYATPELAQQARRAAREKRAKEKREAKEAAIAAALLEAERKRIALEDAAKHERELDAPAEPDLD